MDGGARLGDKYAVYVCAWAVERSQLLRISRNRTFLCSNTNSLTLGIFEVERAKI